MIYVLASYAELWFLVEFDLEKVETRLTGKVIKRTFGCTCEKGNVQVTNLLSGKVSLENI